LWRSLVERAIYVRLLAVFAPQFVLLLCTLCGAKPHGFKKILLQNRKMCLFGSKFEKVAAANGDKTKKRCSFAPFFPYHYENTPFSHSGLIPKQS